MNSDEVKVKYHVRERGRIALMISSYQPNRLGSDLLRIALNSMIRFKTADASVWVIDVGSSKSEFLVTPDEYPTVNFVITDFTPRSWQSTPPIRRLIKQILGFQAPRAGSFAHGLEPQHSNS